MDKIQFLKEVEINTLTLTGELKGEALSNSAEIKKIKEDLSQLSSEKVELVEKVEALEGDVVDIQAENLQQVPLFANSIEECTDTTKLYVLPDGYIYGLMRVVDEGGKPLFKNLADPSTANDSSPNTTIGADEWLNGYYISAMAISARNNCITTNLIPVTSTDTIRIKGIDGAATVAPGTGSYANNLFRILYCDADGNALAYETKPAISNTVEGTGVLEKMDATELENGVYCFTPQNTIRDGNKLSSVSYVRICGYPIDGNKDNVIVTVNAPIEYSKPSDGYQMVNTGHAFVPADYEDRIINLENKVDNLESGNSGAGSGEIIISNDVDILIPSSDVAVVGREYNIYKNTIVFGNMPVEYYDVEIKINDSTATSHNYNEVWRFTPKTAGTYTITITVCNPKMGNNAIYATKTMTLFVVPNTAVTGKNVLFIGDSLTAAGIHTAEIQNNLSNGGITSVGTITTTRTVNGVAITSNHEGRNGWATWDYVGTWADSLTKFQSESNVFRNPSTNKFDLGYYMQKYHPDVTLNAVCLNLGTNGVGATGINVTGMSELISRIREYSAAIPILVHIPIVEGVGDFYAHLGSTRTSQYMKMRWFELAEAFIKEYDGTMANVHVVPVYFNLDENNDFPKTEMTVSARNPATIKRITDGHPNTYGYLKMADVYYAHLLYCMNNTDSDATIYSVTNNLTNVTNNNSASAICEGTGYTATLTANSGYELDTVSVTMGGQAVTVTNGVISIPSVTGNIVITATAKATSAIVNLVNPSTANDASPDTTSLFKDEWLNGYYLSAASIGAKAGCIVTDLFPVSYTQKIKIEGVLLDTTEHQNRFRTHLFKADGSKFRDFASYFNFYADENIPNKGTSIIDVANNTITIDFAAALGNDETNSLAYARFSCYPAGANEDIVVTVVE